MKNLIIAALLTSPLILFSQKNDNHAKELGFQNDAKLVNLEVKVENSESAKQAIMHHLSFTENEDLKLLHSIKSLTGMHYTYIQTYKGFDVRHAHVKVNTDLMGNPTSVFSSKKAISSFKDPQINESQLNSLVQQLNQPTTTNKLLWHNVNNQYQLVMAIEFTDANGNFVEQIYDGNYSLIEQFDLLHHYSDIDTTAKALVFSPNPLTSAGTIYGGKYVDNNDATSPELDAERDTVELKLNYENGSFILENEYLKLVENSLPNIPPVESSSPYFFYNRSQPGFEDVNVFHHITQLQDYIRSLGFTNIVDYQIHVDCHGFNGADNSAFNYGTNPPSIVFGEGGVDDAEDADVIIHEFSHAIMQSASPGTNFGTERNAMDEAFGDYMAVSYSNLYSSHHSDYAFKWDGHNEYWNGRLTTSSLTYPNDLVYHLYTDAPMWSSAITRIERNLGREATVKLAIESAYSFTSGMTMAQAAELYITTDNLLNNGDNYATICWIFKDKGMVNSCSVAKPTDLLSVNNLENETSIKMLNTQNFSLGLGNLKIKSDTKFDVKVYDLSGKLLFQKNNNTIELEMSPNQLEGKAFIFEIQSQKLTKSFKITKAHY